MFLRSFVHHSLPRSLGSISNKGQHFYATMVKERSKWLNQFTRMYLIFLS